MSCADGADGREGEASPALEAQVILWTNDDCFTLKDMDMKKALKLWMWMIGTFLLLTGCGSLKAPVIVSNSSLEGYEYVYITPTKELTSSAGDTYGGEYLVHGRTTTRSVNPSDVIAGSLIKKGFLVLPELEPELKSKTLIVNYGESGRRTKGLSGYTIEVTIQFISAETHELVCSCTAEGQGRTEADDIRIAIRRALAGLSRNE